MQSACCAITLFILFTFAMSTWHFVAWSLPLPCQTPPLGSSCFCLLSYIHLETKLGLLVSWELPLWLPDIFNIAHFLFVRLSCLSLRVTCDVASLDTDICIDQLMLSSLLTHHCLRTKMQTLACDVSGVLQDATFMMVPIAKCPPSAILTKHLH